MPDNTNELIGKLNTAFEAFKAEHTAQLEDVKKGNSDALQALKVDRINSDIDRLQKEVDDANTKIAAAEMGNVSGEKVKDREYTDAFKSHMKRGDIQASMSKGSDPDGGYLAPVEWDRTITDKLVEVSPMRSIASAQPISGPSFTKLFNLRGTASGWVGETAARAETAGPTLGSMAIATGEIYANPAATQQILDDAQVDLEAWLAGEVQTEFSYQEGVAFVSGNGTNKPNGVLTYVTGEANAAANPLGAIASVPSGSVGAIAPDALIDMVHALPGSFTGNARFAMNRNTLAAIRKLKDGDGTYLWQPSYQAGQPSTLAAYAVSELPDMPDVATAAHSVLFGDFKRGYLIVDRAGVRVLRDPYTNKPYVHFYTTKRVGGAVVNPEALKALTIG